MHLTDHFPAIETIEDPTLRTQVTEAWATACADFGIDDLSSVPWFPPAQREHDIDGETLVGHVNDVHACALGLADALDRSRGTDLDRDLLTAGVLVHDLSKLAEFDGMTDTKVGDLLGHPFYGVHLVARVGLPVEYAHIVLSHTSRTPVAPAFLEAALIKRADEAAATAIRATVLDDLREA
ncbi:HD domain-containing protein [Natronomonas sp. EA1]|uniref:HD domain-containing protein n=1 Tax=Natronomonas sp. EA1 TaxID=3421655 RepID=UPI003EBD01DD